MIFVTGDLDAVFMGSSLGVDGGLYIKIEEERNEQE